MNITDLTGNEIIDSDIGSASSTEFLKDSNINAFEFANVLLAGLLPMLITLVNVTTDLLGASVSEQDVADSLISESDSSGDLLSAIDRADSSVSEVDMTEAIMSVTDFLSNVNEAMDVEGTSLSVSEWLGNTIVSTSVTESNTTEYDFNVAYDDTVLSYDGMRPQGVIIDISGS